MQRIMLAVCALWLVLCSHAYAADTLTGAGATFPEPVYKAWASQYSQETKVQYQYKAIGSGGGIQELKKGTVDFGASDAPLLPQELEANGWVQFPSIVGGVVLIVNIPGVSPGKLKLTPEVLCEIFLGKLTQWNVYQITSLNQGIALPASSIITVHRSDASGTTAVFTNYLTKVCEEWQPRVGEGTTVKWPVGVGKKGNAEIGEYVKNTPGAIGYIEYAHARERNLVHTQLRNAALNFVNPSIEGFQEAASTGMYYQGTSTVKKDFYMWLTNSSGKAAWPITAASFIILAKDKQTANNRTAKFIDWAYKYGDAKARELFYCPLPDAVKKQVESYWQLQHISPR
jgi:phosphate transport system substrate-binding protein